MSHVCKELSIFSIDWRRKSDRVVKAHGRLGSVHIHCRMSIRSVDRSRSVCLDRRRSVEHRSGD